jgi:ABC-type dipeptide/oligopeptide/nickel transport system permease subunit
MATIATRLGEQTQAERWEIPQDKPWIVRVSRPWLKNPVGLFGLILVVAFFVLGMFGPYIAPYDPRALDASSRFLTPSLEHPFGTTKFGQDVFSRILEGTRLSMTFGFAVMFFGFIPGSLLGILSGYFGRWVDYAIQRSGEAWAAIPQLPLLLTIIAAVGPGLKAVVVVLAISALFGGSRLLRAVTLVEKHKEHVLAARATGASEFRVLVHHVLPNIMPYILVGISSVFALAVLAEATLSFLGLGVEQGTPGWGIDLSEGLSRGTEYPHLVIFPGIAISLVVLGFNLMGDTLRDILDPRLRGTT